MSFKNDPSKSGAFAARKRLFGENSRYAIAPIHTRFGAVQWFVWDAEYPNCGFTAEVIRQEDCLEDAMRDFMGEHGAGRVIEAFSGR
jgi:hypothetical protein